MKWIVVIFSLFFISCNMKNDSVKVNQSERSMNQPSKSMSDLKEAVISKGDTNAYYELDIAYLDYAFPEEFLPYAIVMANKYDYPQAYFDVFTCLTDIYLSDLNQLDEKTASLAIDYLLKAYEKGHHQAKEIVQEHNITNNKNSKQDIKEILQN